MLKGAFVLAGKTVNTASNLASTLKDGGNDAVRMYEYGRDSTTVALAKTKENQGLHPQGWSVGSMMNSMKSSVSGLLTVQDVSEGKYISKGSIIQDPSLGDGDGVQFNLMSSLNSDKNIIMKGMLELELEGMLKVGSGQGDYVKTSHGSVFVNEILKERMIKEDIFTKEKYNETLNILIRFKELQELPGFIADSLVSGAKMTISLLIDILLLKFLFSVL